MPQTNDERERTAAQSSACGEADSHCGEQWLPSLVGSARAMPTFLTLCSMIGEGTQRLGAREPQFVNDTLAWIDWHAPVADRVVLLMDNLPER